MPTGFRVMMLLTLGSVGWATASCTAHPTHASLAEAQWNPDTRTLEVSVHLVANHLEDAIQQATGNQEFRLEQADAEESICAYAQSRFTVTAEGSQSTPSEMEWVGIELKTQDAWLYFEFTLPANWNRLTLQNSLLFDVVQRQTNIVAVRVGDQTRTLVFSPDRKQRALRFVRPQRKPTASGADQPATSVVPNR